MKNYSVSKTRQSRKKYNHSRSPKAAAAAKHCSSRRKSSPARRQPSHSSSTPAKQQCPPALLPDVSRSTRLALLTAVLDDNPVAIIITDRFGSIRHVNKRARLLLPALADVAPGHGPTELQQTGMDAHFCLQIRQALDAGRMEPVHIKTHHKTNSTIWESALVIPVAGQKIPPFHYLLFLGDNTLFKSPPTWLRLYDHFDALTDLPTRYLFIQRLLPILTQADQNKTMVGIILLGLDRFKTINHTLGHTAGDRLIQLVGRHLQGEVGPEDIVARMGSDEFLLLLPNIQDFRQISQKVNMLRESFAQPFSVADRDLHMNISMGICLYPDDGHDPLVLLRNADTALQEAKDSGRNTYRFYTAKLYKGVKEQFSLENALHRALAGNEFRLFYQPLVHIQSGQVLGMEALVRWQHPKLGLLSPDHFIPLTEETGFIVPLGHWIMQTACRQIVHWHHMGFSALRMSVNLSARQFQEPELVETILGICRDAGLDPSFLQIEITESVFLKNVHITRMILHWLSKKGITVALDDFGTGYSSLTYLKRFPIHTIKIDRSFIQDCLRDTDDAAIVTTIASIARNLKMYITAEGVEEAEQLAFLRNLGCDNFQGFFFSAPLPADDFTSLLAQGRCLQHLEQPETGHDG
ncbi:EAL domain-containing protein [candidate division FCPU426 bacterium]|nr:EAL domain-containing protein [candidate division FCPU426 bacterium]